MWNVYQRLGNDQGQQKCWKNEESHSVTKCHLMYDNVNVLSPFSLFTQEIKKREKSKGSTKGDNMWLIKVI